MGNEKDLILEILNSLKGDKPLSENDIALIRDLFERKKEDSTIEDIFEMTSLQTNIILKEFNKMNSRQDRMEEKLEGLEDKFQQHLHEQEVKEVKEQSLDENVHATLDRHSSVYKEVTDRIECLKREQLEKEKRTNKKIKRTNEKLENTSQIWEKRFMYIMFALILGEKIAPYLTKMVSL